MRIGIDIDGVLTDVERFQYENATKFFKLKYNKEMINPNGYDPRDMFDITEKQNEDFWSTYMGDYLVSGEVRKYASEVISKLRSSGIEVYIITARGALKSHSMLIAHTIKENKLITKKWLAKNKIHYDKIIFCGEEKLSVCLENKIDIMIDDSPYNMKSLSTKIPVITLNANYNMNINNSNIIRCYSWYDIYNKVMSKYENSK